MKKKRLITFLVLSIILLIIVLVFAIYKTTLGQIQHDKINSKDVSINNDIDENTLLEQKGFTNIAVFGLDNRSSGSLEKGNTDTIMIVSINNETKAVKLLSVYRDTYLKTGSGYSKANAAYNNGGPAQALAMLNANLDLTITDYVAVNWAALVQAIDALDGIDIEITDQEKNQINKHMAAVEKMVGHKSSTLSQSGLQHLDGIQATTYARIRRTAGNDYKRTSRQRIVVEKMLEKAKTNPTGLVTHLEAILGSANIRTSLSNSYMIELLMKVKDYSIMETSGFPFELTNATINGSDVVIPVELENNVSELHKFLFDSDDYVMSPTVMSLSDDLVKLTGIDGSALLTDTSEYNNTVGQDGTIK